MADQESSHPEGDDESPDRISFHFIKSNFFRVIQIDGVWGGITSSGHLHMTVYNERTAIPTKLVYRLSKDGSLDDEILAERQTKNGVVRELEADLVMDLDTARGLRDWLTNAISEAEQILNDSEV